MVKNEQISPAQMMLSIVSFIQTSILMTAFVTRVTMQETWIAVITGFAISLPILWIYISLAAKFPGKNLIEINDCVLGPVLGKVVSSLYILFFFSLMFLNSRNASDFITGSILSETPLLAVLIMFVGVCVFAARKGLKCITSYAMIFVLIASVTILFNFMLLLDQMSWDNFLPVFSLELPDYLQATHTVAILPFCEIFVFMMFLPNLQNANKTKSVFFGGLALGAATVLVVIIRSTAVLGSSIGILSLSTYDTIRLINIGDIFTRMEVLYIPIYIMQQFFKTTILLYATMTGIAQIFGLKSSKMLAPSIGALAVCMAFISFESANAHGYWGQNVAAVYSSFFIVILPLITLLIAVVRKVRKERA